ncbi:MAG: hypothetical protein ACIAQF_10995, partial [Phycisphaerales bacterium JB065]
YRSIDWSAFIERTGERPEPKLERSQGHSYHFPQMHDGPVFTGEKVVADKGMIQKLRKDWPKASGVEMECAGVAQAAQEQRGSCKVVMVKGISDFSDEVKDDGWREYACRCAAVLVFETISRLTDRDLDPRTEFSKQDLVHGTLALIAPRLDGDHGFQFGLASQLVEATIDETSKVVKEDYSENLSTGAQFLVRARKIFQPAESVLAVSVDAVSTFWTDFKNRSAAYQYLQSQSENTKRLFVFHSADAAHNYGRILDEHNKKYGNVFVTTLEHYRRFLKEWGAPEDVLTIKKDFAILDYAGGSSGKSASLLATLDDHKLFFKRLAGFDGITGGGWVERFRSQFDRMSMLDPSCLDSNKTILRWSHLFWNNKLWPDRLRELFGDDRKSDVFHLVFFKGGSADESRVEKLNKVYSALRKRQRNGWKDRFGMLDVWIGRREHWAAPPIDGRLGGEISVDAGPEFEFVIIMKFSSREGLREYYQDKEHSKLREQLYTSFDDRLKVLYEVGLPGTRQPDSPEAEHQRKLVYECIESLAIRTIERFDFRDDRSIDQMTEEEPYKPLPDPATTKTSTSGGEPSELDGQVTVHSRSAEFAKPKQAAAPDQAN